MDVGFLQLQWVILANDCCIHTEESAEPLSARVVISFWSSRVLWCMVFPSGKYQNCVDYRIPSGYWKSDVWPQMCSALSLGENSLVFLWYGVCFICTAYVGAFREDPIFEGWPKVERSARFEMKHAWVALPVFITVELTCGLSGNGPETQILLQWPAQADVCALCTLMSSLRTGHHRFPKYLQYSPFWKGLAHGGIRSLG